MSERTIAAIATAAGEAAMGVIRISGDEALSVADKVFFPVSEKPLSTLAGYRAAYGEIRENGACLDDAVALVFRAPNSYTGEDTVEITVHGGRLMLSSVLRLIYKNGAYPAEPGEFTKRAFLNGKTDLTRAESIMGLISAENEAQLRLSRAAHNGRVSRKIYEIEADLTAAAASIAAFSDYPDEDIEGLDYDSFSAMLSNAATELEKMLKSYDTGKIINEGISAAIVGKPNVGKSTLMNMLSGSERSIVTDVAGTTRDVVEETVSVGDVTLRLADTAGLRTTDDTVESIGIELARRKMESSQLVLAVFDSTKELESEDIELIDSLRERKAIAVINKCDINGEFDTSPFDGIKVVKISAKKGLGMEELVSAVSEACLLEPLDSDTAVLLGERQHACAVKALEGVREALNALQNGTTTDAVGVCVDDALANLLALTGKRVTNEVTDEIFRRFCVGK